MVKIECVVDSKCQLGEGPCWQPSDNAIYWTDIPAKQIHRYRLSDGEHRIWNTPEMVGTIAPRSSGGLVLASKSGVDLFDPASEKMERIAAPELSMPGNRSNDGKCDRQGRFWFGTMQDNFAADGGEIPITNVTGSLYRVDPDRKVQKIDGPFGISNTFAWSPDNRVFYFADTQRGIFAYEFDAASGTVSNRRLFAAASAPSQLGDPDGSTIDSDGCLWNCRWDGAAIVRYAPNGRVDRVIDMPCDRVTSCIFGGQQLDTLFVTTVRRGISPERLRETPLAGALFAVDVGAQGVPDGAFAG